MKALILLSFIIACLTVQGQNKAPKITAQNQAGSYGQQVCIDIMTTDEDNDSVVVWWNKGISGTFTSNSHTVRFASGQVCATLTRGTQPVGDNFFTVFASDGNDTTTKICNILVRDYPYKVHPVITKLSYNTFEIDVKGDVNEPWNNYIGLIYQSKVLDEANNVILTDTHRVFTFTAPTYQKYRVLTTYKTAAPDAYTSADTLFPDANTAVFSAQKNIVSVYPNPAVSTIALTNLPQNAVAISITDISGKTLATQAVAINNQLTITSLPAGSYFIQVYGANTTLLGIAKFVKQ